MYGDDDRTASTETAPQAPFSEAAVRLAQFRRALFTSTPRVFVTHALIAINCAVFAAMICTGVSLLTPNVKDLVRWGANYGPLTIGGEWWRLLTAAFLHSGIIHIGLNMVILYNVGVLVERLLGNVGFLVMYLVSAVLASLASLLIHPSTVSVGASGAVFGVVGALGGFLLRQRTSIPREVLQPLGKNVLVFIVLNLAFSLAVPRIDMSAHVGGLIAGFLCGLVQARPLTQPSATDRTIRNGLTAFGGVALLFLGSTVLSKIGAPSDWIGAFDRFATIEEKVIDRYNTALTQLRQQKISEDEFARTLAEDVLPDWSKVKEELVQMHGLTGQEGELMAKFRQYAVDRQEVWQLMLEAIRERSPQKMEQAHAKEKALNQEVEELQKANK
jgi:rhomboid protease GluP